VNSVANARQDCSANKIKYSWSFLTQLLFKGLLHLEVTEREKEKFIELPVFIQSGLMTFSCPSEANLPKFVRRFQGPS
jgi:hypothetical protein